MQVAKGDHAEFFFEAALAGVRYGLTAIPGDSPASLDVAILEIGAILTDTSQMMVYYAAACAVWDALDVEPEKMPEVDPVGLTVTFPLWP